jgi:hypothetical protein
VLQHGIIGASRFFETLRDKPHFKVFHLLTGLKFDLLFSRSCIEGASRSGFDVEPFDEA